MECKQLEIYSLFKNYKCLKLSHVSIKDWHVSGLASSTLKFDIKFVTISISELTFSIYNQLIPIATWFSN